MRLFTKSLFAKILRRDIDEFLMLKRGRKCIYVQSSFKQPIDVFS